MAPPRAHQPDPWEQEYAIRELVKAVETLTEQVALNANGNRQNREDMLIMKTRWGFLVGISSLCSGMISAVVVAFVKGALHL